MRRAGARRLACADVVSLILLASWHLIYFLPVTIGQSVWFTTDVVRLFHPFAVELASALNQGRLPLWTPGILSGFPLLAEGQVGALYPLNWVLFKILPTHNALSYSILLHLVWGAWGMYWFARALGLGRGAAILAGLVVSFSGFVYGHLSHPAVIATIAWLPWMVLFQRQWANTRRAVWLGLTTLACGLQLLTGSAQMAFLNMMAFAFFGIEKELTQETPPTQIRQKLASFAYTTVLPLGLGLGIASVQLIPTIELIQYSVRRETTADFATSYSLPLTALTQFVFPFSEGEPAEGNGEYWAYFGLGAFCLAAMAPILHRNRKTFALMGFVAAAGLFALGNATPVYPLLAGFPVFGLFRVPARYMYLAIFGASVLAAYGLDYLTNRLTVISGPSTWIMRLLVPAAVLSSLVVAKVQPPEIWLPAWYWIPFGLVILFSVIIAGAFTRHISSASFAVAVIGLAAVDLALYAPPFMGTIDALTPSSYVSGAPRSLASLADGDGLGRVFTDLSVFPSIPALRGSLFPNTSLAFGRASAQGYTSLAFAGQEAFVFDPSPSMLNVMNVKYWTVPLEPRPVGKRSMPAESMGLDVINNEMLVPSTRATQIRIVSYTEQADKLLKGTVVAQLRVRLANADLVEFPIRAGIETEDWDIERKNAGQAVSVRRARIAHDLNGYWRSLGRQFEGHAFEMQYDLPSSAEVVGVEVQISNEQAQLGIESVWLEDPDSGIHSLARLGGRNDFVLRYMSDTVAVWENMNALPRAFLVHSAEIADNRSALALLKQAEFDPTQTVILDKPHDFPNSVQPVSGKDQVSITDYQPERVGIQVHAEQGGFLVLSDSWYPGWQASVDGKATPILLADSVFRAIPINTGSHTVVFEYRPMSFALGILVTMASLTALVAIVVFIHRTSRPRDASGDDSAHQCAS